MFTLCVGLVFRSKYVQFPIICSLQYSININTVEVDPHSDLLHIGIVKPLSSVANYIKRHQPHFFLPLLTKYSARYEAYHSGRHFHSIRIVKD